MAATWRPIRGDGAAGYCSVEERIASLEQLLWDKVHIQVKVADSIVVLAFNDVARRGARVLVGAEQGVLIILLCTRSLVLEAACRARIVANQELA